MDEIRVEDEIKVEEIYLKKQDGFQVDSTDYTPNQRLTDLEKVHGVQKKGVCSHEFIEKENHCKYVQCLSK